MSEDDALARWQRDQDHRAAVREGREVEPPAPIPVEPAPGYAYFDDAPGFPMTKKEHGLWKRFNGNAQKKGWAPGAILTQWLQTQIEITRFNALQASDPRGWVANKMAQDALHRAHQRLLAAETFLKKESQEGKLESDAIVLLDGYHDRSKEFIRDHAGEFAFLAELECPNCGTKVKETVSTDGLPWWGCRWEKDGKGEIIYLKWSPEVMYLYDTGQITMAQAAFILQTSPKGLIYTARRRNEEIKPCDEAAEEKALAKLRKDSGWPAIPPKKK